MINFNKGINQIIPIRVTFGGAIVGFDFRKLLNDNGDIVAFRIYDNELPDNVQKEFIRVMQKIADIAESEGKLANIDQLRDTLNIFDAREKMTDENAKKQQALIEKHKNDEKK